MKWTLFIAVSVEQTNIVTEFFEYQVEIIMLFNA